MLAPGTIAGFLQNVQCADTDSTKARGNSLSFTDAIWSETGNWHTRSSLPARIFNLYDTDFNVKIVLYR